MGNEKWKPETLMITSGKLEPDVKANCECARLGNAVCAGFFYNSYCFCEVTEVILVQEAVFHGLFSVEFFGKSWSSDRINSWEIYLSNLIYALR